jgi:Rieske Fe-S protein
MTHDVPSNPATDRSPADCAEEQLPCPGRRAMLGCALAVTAAQFFGISEAAAATAGQWTSAGAPSTFTTGTPKLVKLVSGKAPVFVTKLSATSWQVLYAVCTHEARSINLAPGHPNYAFRCPRHGAKFAKDGKVLANQEAKRALVKLPAKVVKNKVMVNVAGFI